VIVVVAVVVSLIGTLIVAALVNVNDIVSVADAVGATSGRQRHASGAASGRAEPSTASIRPTVSFS